MITDEAAGLYKARAVRAAALVHVATTPPARFWIGGAGTLVIAADAVDITGGVYSGLGEVQDMSPIQALINGETDVISIVLGALSPDIVAWAKTDAALLRGVDVAIGYMALDENLNQASDLLWWEAGEIQSTPIEFADEPDGDETGQVTLLVASQDAKRRRPALGRWTDAMHQRKEPGDLFFKNMPRYNQNTTLEWPSPV